MTINKNTTNVQYNARINGVNAIYPNVVSSTPVNVTGYNTMGLWSFVFKLDVASCASYQIVQFTFNNSGPGNIPYFSNGVEKVSSVIRVSYLR